MEQVLEIGDRFYILAGADLLDARTLVLKHGDTFAIFNPHGDIEAIGRRSEGLFTEGMRHLSRLGLRLNGARPLLLGSRIVRDNTRMTADLTNPDMEVANAVVMPRGSLHLARTRYLWNNSLFERLTLSSYAEHSLHADVTITFGCDFADIFEVRGTERSQRGTSAAPEVHGDNVVFIYDGLDGVRRSTIVRFDPPPTSLSASEARFERRLAPHERLDVRMTVRCETGIINAALRDGSMHFDACLDQRLAETTAQRAACARVVASNAQVRAWLDRSLADILMLNTQTPQGLYPYAGIPWFSTQFGRDGIITALQMLWVNPEMARGVLGYLASTQAREVDPLADAEPGKILHERRTDEMAAIGEVPFGKYYGSVDATPLFVMLAGAYYSATADLEFIRSIWDNIEAALAWIDNCGDIDGDGFVDYQRKAPDGLGNQGWKDAHDSIMHADGELAHAPIALCEVQGYVYDAKMRAADLAEALADGGGGATLRVARLDAERRATVESPDAERRATLLARAQALRQQARALKHRFHEAFWLDDLGMYALALDRDKRPCAVRASNAGHCLFTGIADHGVAARLRDALLSRAMLSGWGIRTLARGERRYNPMSYHNGSVWPHDNSIIAAGFARYGFRDAALRIFECMLRASTHLDLHRLPELYCGFPRRKGDGPTLYPVACNPQAWAAGAGFMLLSACLGLTLDAPRKHLVIHSPRLPRTLDEVRIDDLRIGGIGGSDGMGAGARVSLLFHRERRDVGVLVLKKTEGIDVVVTK